MDCPSAAGSWLATVGTRREAMIDRRDVLRLLGLAATAALLGGAVPARGADTQTGDPDQAVALTGALTGQLAAGAGGHFAYYKFAYPGSVVTTVNVRVTPDDPVVLRNVGFKVYGPAPGKVYLTGGAQPGLVPNLSGDLISAEPGLYLVQVFNFDPRVSVDFTIWASGLPEAVRPSGPPRVDAPQPGEVPTPTTAAGESTPIPTVQPTPEPTPAQADDPGRAVPLTRDLRGQLEPGGHFAYYTVDYPGGVAVTVNLRVVPDDPNVLRNVGFRVYGPTPGKVYLTSGAQPGLTPNVSGDLISPEPGVYLVQVYNYDPRTTVYFTAWATGVPAHLAPAAPGLTPPPASG
jgi:hypothetical protein